MREEEQFTRKETECLKLQADIAAAIEIFQDASSLFAGSENDPSWKLEVITSMRMWALCLKKYICIDSSGTVEFDLTSWIADGLHLMLQRQQDLLSHCDAGIVNTFRLTITEKAQKNLQEYL